jgi:gliding motility-associated-like protein
MLTPDFSGMPFVDIGPADTLLCEDEKLFLPMGTSLNVSTYLWNGHQSQPAFTVEKPGIYYLKVSNQCGEYSDTIQVDFKNCKIWLPDAFTPNNDGLNDKLHLLGDLTDVYDCSIAIYNRTGNLVFYSQDKNAAWNGQYKGILQSAGTFHYQVSFKLNGREYYLKGNVMLII